MLNLIIPIPTLHTAPLPLRVAPVPRATRTATTTRSPSPPNPSPATSGSRQSRTAKAMRRRFSTRKPRRNGGRWRRRRRNAAFRHDGDGSALSGGSSSPACGRACGDGDGEAGGATADEKATWVGRRFCGVRTCSCCRIHPCSISPVLSVQRNGRSEVGDMVAWRGKGATTMRSRGWRIDARPHVSR